MRNLTLCFVISLSLCIFASCCSKCKSQAATASDSPLSAHDAFAAPSGQVENGVRVIKMTARKYEFNPSVITVNEGDKVRLEITSTDVRHGFGLKEFNVDRTIEPGATTTIEFTADKPGTFNYHCTVICGVGHLGMKGKLIVQPTAQ